MTKPAPWIFADDILALHQIGRWIGEAGRRTARRRRLFFLVLAAPGFFAVFTTPMHRSLLGLGAGALSFAAACLLRAWSEPIFERAEAAALGPSPHPEENSHA